MQVDDIRRLVKLVEESDIDELEVRRWWEFLRITKRARVHADETRRATVSEGPRALVAQASAVPAPTSVASTQTPPLSREAPPSLREAETAASAQAPAETRPENGADDGLVIIRSPMVGTFYRAPNPTAQPFVEAGSRVAVRQAVCIVEAMKLMNEIESDVGGTVERILVENGKPVEYNQPLFLVRPD
jgi:acetyl-CoA carboxylase biotin carboxyl carrier protein